MLEADVQFDQIRDRVMGAGILPLAFKDGRPYLLLGKERHVNHWRGSLKWSGFEGGRKPAERPEYTAAREFVEESLGTVSLLFEESEEGVNEIKEDRIKRIADALTIGKYILRIVLCIVHPDVNIAQRRYHVTYVVQVPYRESFVATFNSRRVAFVELNVKAEQLKRCTDALSVSLPCHNRKFNARSVKAVTRVEQTTKMLKIEFVNDLDEIVVHDATDIAPETRVAYCTWFQSRMLCMSELEKIQDTLHPSALQEVVHDSVGTLVSLRLNEDFIEKQTIQWWDARTLVEVLENGGCYQSEYFRAYFLPVLQRTLFEINLL